MTTTAVASVTGDLSRAEYVALGEALGYGDALAKPEPALPVGSLMEAIPYLRRPFTADAVKWKVQTSYPKDEPRAGQVIAYIDARLVIERLNLVCPTLWSERFELFSTGQGGQSSLWCHLTIDGVTHSDIGEGKGKALVSDARKRAAVAHGIGVSLYALPAVKMQAGTAKDRLPIRGPQGKRTLRIEAAQTEWLKIHYESWLDTIGIKAFGEPLDHGDVLGAAGDPHDPDAPADEATEQLFDDPDPKVAATGRKIGQARAESLIALFNERCSDRDPDELLAQVARVTGREAAGPEALRELRSSQAEAVQAWIEGGS